jgi:hypothetical protein
MTGQEFLVVVGCIGALMAIAYLFRRPKSGGEIPRIDEVAACCLGEQESVDPGKYYVVLVDTDPGLFFAYCCGDRIPKILEFATLDEARTAAREGSVDPEGELFACVFRGRDEYLAIFNNGEEP